MKIVYMINDQCNTACFHCYRGKYVYEKDVKECERDISCLLNQGHEIVVAGAEVLLEPEKIKLFQINKQNHLLTNGIIIASNPSILEMIYSRGIRRIEISWHIGFTRLIKSMPEEETIEAIKRIRERGFELQVNCVICNENFDQAKVIAETVLKNGVSEVRFLQLMATSEKTLPYLLSEYQKEYFLEDIQKIRQAYEKNVLRTILHGNFNANLTSKSAKAKQSGLFCPAGKEFAVVESDNRVYPCPYLVSDNFCIGFLREGRVTMTREFEHDGCNCIAEKLLQNKK